MLFVVGLGFGEDDDVVDVDLTERAVLVEDEVHGPLECRRSVTQSKRHDSELVGTVSGLKGGAFSVFWNNQHLVETRPEDHFGENAPTSYSVDAFVDPRHRVYDFQRELVESAAVDVHAEYSVMFARKEYSSSKSGACRPDPTVSKILVQLLFQLYVLRGAHAEYPMARWDGVGDQVNAVVRGS